MLYDNLYEQIRNRMFIFKLVGIGDNKVYKTFLPKSINGYKRVSADLFMIDDTSFEFVEGTSYNEKSDFFFALDNAESKNIFGFDSKKYLVCYIYGLNAKSAQDMVNFGKFKYEMAMNGECSCISKNISSLEELDFFLLTSQH